MTDPTPLPRPTAAHYRVAADVALYHARREQEEGDRLARRNLPRVAAICYREAMACYRYAAEALEHACDLSDHNEDLPVVWQHRVEAERLDALVLAIMGGNPLDVQPR